MKLQKMAAVSITIQALWQDFVTLFHVVAFGVFFVKTVYNTDNITSTVSLSFVDT